jgi:hypothetical protein
MLASAEVQSAVLEERVDTTMLTGKLAGDARELCQQLAVSLLVQLLSVLQRIDIPAHHVTSMSSANSRIVRPRTWRGA